ncbi:MAG TPA: cytochrome c-type biogenesis protein [Stenotrophobium sp.]|nr:cytochrome c-type biogenesis protein [Stenotrophobium sp.]
MKQSLVLILALWLGTGAALAAGPQPEDSFAADVQGSLNPAQEARYQALTRELRCMVCMNESIADSTAALANDMRMQVRKQIIAGRSDAQILKYLTDRYGDFVLYNPPFKRLTLLLWLGPLLLVLLALALALAFVRRSHRRSKAVTVNEQALKQLLDENRPS